MHGSGVTWLLDGQTIVNPTGLFDHGRRKWIMRLRDEDIHPKGARGVRINLIRSYSSRRLFYVL